MGAEFIKTSFEGATLQIDGNSYSECKFKACILVYSGGELPSFVGCSLHATAFEFAGSASNTLSFLKAIYHGMGDGGRSLIEVTFDQLKMPFDSDRPSDGGA